MLLWFHSVFWYSSQSFFDLITLTSLKKTGQLLCKMSFSLGLSDIFSQLDLGYASLAGDHRSDVALIASYLVVQYFNVSCYWGQLWCLDKNGISPVKFFLLFIPFHILILGSQQNWEVQIFLIDTCTAAPLSEWYVCYNWWTWINTS